MKIKFKNQSYQDDAVNSIVDVFIGQTSGFRRDLIGRQVVDTGIFAHEEDIISYGNNKISLSPDELRKNIKEVQRRNDLDYTDNQGLKNYSIEMETGTGKTFTYIKTMYELNKNYGWSKFIVITPSIAIREGVEKSFKLTEDFFQGIYNKKIRYFVYNSNNSSNIANINSFASDESIQVMIMNYQAFNASGEKNRRIYDELDELQSRRPIDVINTVNPILIVDEPQKMGKTEEMLDKLNPLFIVRYSATHKKDREYNKMYRLDALDAFNRKLVKKINVKGLEFIHDKSEGAYMYLDRVNISTNKDPEAIMELDYKTSTGTNRKLFKVRAGDNLKDLSGGLIQYEGYVVSEVDGRLDNYDNVKFINGTEIRTGEIIGNVDEDQFVRMQIRETIISHFEKEKSLFKKGIKVLSLFFIDEVKNYRDYDEEDTKGKYAHVFEEEYQNIANEYRDLHDPDYTRYLDSFNKEQVHQGYFSIDKKGHAIDGKIDKKTNLSDDEDAYDLIMKDKERLLSLDEPVRFIFSHSALREGWDNPNIFQICTLKHSNSEISKRQEIGRGLRICVDNYGNRMDLSELEGDFFGVNALTIIASESYDSFARSLQSELAESLRDRPRHLTFEYLKKKVEIVNKDGSKLEMTDMNVASIMMSLNSRGYIDANGKVQQSFKDAVDTGEIIFEDYPEFNEELTNIVRKIYETDNTKLINDVDRNHIRELIPNSNFEKQEFKDLWNKINYQSVYEVEFNTDELIEKCVNAINGKLHIARMLLKITSGGQQDKMTIDEIRDGSVMSDGKQTVKKIDSFTDSSVKYDLIGEIVRDTNLTRKTVGEILYKISTEKFNLFRNNPEEFIRKVCNLINEEKATTVIEGITYHKTESKFSNDIFTINNLNGELGTNAIDVKKHIYNYLVTDSKIEIEFAKKLESGQVTVYAKLPNGFKIPTPVGNYNPDWAIVFDNDDFKYVYFIAETKGSMSSMQLRDVEKAKIACARKHFELIEKENPKIHYDVVNSYDELISLLTT